MLPPAALNDPLNQISNLTLGGGRKHLSRRRDYDSQSSASLFRPISGSHSGSFILAYIKEATPVIKTPWKSLANSFYKHQTEER